MDSVITWLHLGVITTVFSSACSVQCSLPLGRSIFQGNGTISSPSYPSYPRQNERCSWLFNVSEHQLLVLEVVDVKLYRDFRCGRGYGRQCKDCLQTFQIAEIEIPCKADSVRCLKYAHEGHCISLQSSYSNCETLTLNRIPVDFSSTKVTMERGNPPKGFRLEYKIIDCATERSTTPSSSGNVTSSVTTTTSTTAERTPEGPGEPNNSEQTAIVILSVFIGILVVTIIIGAILLYRCYRTLHLQKTRGEASRGWRT